MILKRILEVLARFKKTPKGSIVLIQLKQDCNSDVNAGCPYSSADPPHTETQSILKQTACKASH